MLKTIKFAIGLVMLLLPTLLIAQDKYWNTKGDILDYYESLKKSDSSFQYIIDDKVNVLRVNIIGEDCLTINHYFKPDYQNDVTNESLCDSLIIDLKCLDCINDHIIRLLGSNIRRWNEITDTLYMSDRYVAKYKNRGEKKRNVFPVMLILSTQKATTITIYGMLLTRKEWKKYYELSY